MSQIYANESDYSVKGSSPNLFDIDVIKQLEDILSPEVAQKEASDADERINEIANELKSFISSSSQESDTTNGVFHFRRVNRVHSDGAIIYEPKYHRRDNSTREKSRVYRERKKIKNDQLDKQLNYKIMVNESLKKKVDLLEQVTKILKNTINCTYKINHF